MLLEVILFINLAGFYLLGKPAESVAEEGEDDKHDGMRGKRAERRRCLGGAKRLKKGEFGKCKEGIEDDGCEDTCKTSEGREIFARHPERDIENYENGDEQVKYERGIFFYHDFFRRAGFIELFDESF